MPEVTQLTPAEETAFRAWVERNGITDLDHPDSHYDYRGFWKATGGAPRAPGLMTSRGTVGPPGHFPDTFKQHGHPTFSQESQYSRGPRDGGMWVGENDTLLAQPPMAPSHQTNVLGALLQQLNGR
jgi:hypothetical protein